MGKTSRVSYTLYMRYGERKISFPFFASDDKELKDIVFDILMRNSFLEFDSLKKIVESDVDYDYLFGIVKD